MFFYPLDMIYEAKKSNSIIIWTAMEMRAAKG